MKLFSSEGRVIPAMDGEKVLAAYHAGTTAWAAHDEVGKTECLATEETFQEHLRFVLDTVDVEAIRRKRFRVALDANHGAGAVLGRPLLEALGCNITIMGEQPTGQFAHTPEPLAENLVSVVEQAKQAKADVIFCQDPDADRLAVIDETGRYIGEECTLAICVEHLLESQAANRSVITNCSTSRMTQDIAEKYGVPFYRSAVGEANVVDAMKKHNALLGGEGNGGVIDPRVGWVRDSFVGMAMILDRMASTGKPISELANALPQYAIHKTKFPLEREKMAATFAQLETHFLKGTSKREAAVSDKLDGLRLDWPGAWLLIRASNTEPVVRVIAEAKTAAMAKSLCEEAASVLV